MLNLELSLRTFLQTFIFKRTVQKRKTKALYLRKSNLPYVHPLKNFFLEFRIKKKLSHLKKEIVCFLFLENKCKPAPYISHFILVAKTLKVKLCPITEILIPRTQFFF